MFVVPLSLRLVIFVNPTQRESGSGARRPAPNKRSSSGSGPLTPPVHLQHLGCNVVGQMRFGRSNPRSTPDNMGGRDHDRATNGSKRLVKNRRELVLGVARANCDSTRAASHWKILF